MSDAGRANIRMGSYSEPTDFSMVPLAWLAAGTFVVGLILYGIQQALKLPSGYGIEDFLGWHSPAVIKAAISNWCPDVSTRWRGAVVYMLADTSLFMPFYGALILACGLSLGRSLQSGPAPLARLLKIALQPVTWLLVCALWIIDALENFGGTQRLGLAAWIFSLSLLIGIVLFLFLWKMVLADVKDQARVSCRNALLLLLAFAAVGLLARFPDLKTACDSTQAHVGDYSLAWAHRAKPWLITLALSPIVVGSLIWWFGVDLDLIDDDQRLMAEQRAAWRAGVAGVIGRSRYVLLLLALFATFTLVLDQCRDVLLSLAGPLQNNDTREFAWRLFVLILGAMSIATLAYSSWLWTRLVVMVERPGLALPGGHSVYDRVGEFARGWARAVSLLPLLIVCILLAHTAGDAAAAAAAAKSGPAADTLRMTLFLLSLFGTIAIVGGYAFLEIRRGMPMARLSDYYNSDADLFDLLQNGTHTHRLPGETNIAATRPGSWCHKIYLRIAHLVRPLKPVLVGTFTLIGRPVVLPLVCLAWMLVLRACMAWLPEMTALAPTTLALLGFGLSWWMGVAGAVSMFEQRQTIPWGLIALGALGLLSNVVDNHVLPLNRFKDASPEAALVTLRHLGLMVTVALSMLGCVWWLAATYRGRSAYPTPGTIPRHTWRLRAAISIAAFLVMVAVLSWIDRTTQAVFSSPLPVSNMHKLDVGINTPKEKPPAIPDGKNVVYLVASEGGGIRSAYWTARVLAELHDKAEASHFEARAVVLSGVSGGAIGEAVYVACLRKGNNPSTSQTSVVECVQQQFARLDPLSPLIGSFMFEDVFARVLPVRFGKVLSICTQPGCGFLSRALAFEREWMRQFPALAEPLGRHNPGEPELMLNSTWVETGNRVVFSTFQLSPEQIPASVDASKRLGAQPSLIAAAHAASRFPFINPLAAVRPVYEAKDAGSIVGHLADGGYHDNSGTESLADIWHVVRTKLPPNWRAQLILIRNGQTRQGCEKYRDREPLAACLTKISSMTKDLAAPVDRPLMNLYADLLGPAVAVVNVSGIGAHGRQSPATLLADLNTSLNKGSDNAPAPLPPCLIDQSTEATLVPLGWYLSAAAKEAMNAQVNDAISQPDCFPGLKSP